jgi:hypothetical protein
MGMHTTSAGGTTWLIDVNTGETKWSSTRADADRAVAPLAEASDAIAYLYGCAAARGANLGMIERAASLARAGLEALAELATVEKVDEVRHDRISRTIAQLQHGLPGGDGDSLTVRTCVSLFDRVTRGTQNLDLDLYGGHEFREELGPILGRPLAPADLSDESVADFLGRWRAMRLDTKLSAPARVAILITFLHSIGVLPKPSSDAAQTKAVMQNLRRSNQLQSPPAKPKAPLPLPKNGTPRTPTSGR